MEKYHNKKTICPYCKKELEIAFTEVKTINAWIAWGRCNECGMSSGAKQGATKEEAVKNALVHLSLPFEKE